jgi:hypothetical protein
MLLNVALKHVFQRARPVFEDPLVTLATYSFPAATPRRPPASMACWPVIW